MRQFAMPLLPKVETSMIKAYISRFDEFEAEMGEGRRCHLRPIGKRPHRMVSSPT